ncbi:MAG TPA: insulinase family protein [Allosphingosinicella sp.]|nr:insulinase family protein [Allosphingosinicella sp.]
MTSRISLLALAAGLALAAPPALSQTRPAAAAPAPAWPQQASDLPADPDVRFGALPNGMRYAIRRNATPPGGASLRLRFDAGSLHEGEDQRGLAHFLEHMVLNGTTNVPEGEFVRRLERHGLRFGPDTNATTEFQQTVFKLDLPRTDAETVDTALFLLREVAGEATLAAAAIDAERGIVQSEERSRATPQFNVVVDELGYMLPGQLLPNRMPIGRPEVIAGAPRERFAAFYNSYYRPERATLVAVGDFDLDEMERKIRARFGTWRGRGPAGRNPDLGRVATRGGQARVHVAAGVPTRVSLAWVRAPDLRPDTAATRSARLVEQLALQILNRRMERIAATQSPAPFIAGVSVRTTLADSADITQLMAITQPGQWQAGLTAIEVEQRRLALHGVTAAELAREIQQLRTALTAAAAGAATRQSAALAEGLIAAVDQDRVFTAPAETLRRFEQAAPAITPAQVDAAARAIFAGDPLLYMTSPTPVEGGESALLAAYRTAYSTPVAAGAAQQAQAWPYTSFGAPGIVAERRELAEVGATAIRFANGVRLTVKRTAFADDQILVSVRTGNGRQDFAADRPSPEWALPGAFSAGGLGRISFEDMQEALAARTYGADLVVGDDAFQLIGGTRPEDFALQMQLLAAYVTDPGWRPTGWDRMRGFSGTLQDQAAATPGGVFGRDSGRLLHDGDRRWAMPSREEMAASSIADARFVLDRALGQGPIEIVIVGDVEVEEAIRQAAATFGALPPRADAAPPATRIRFPAGTAEPVRLTHAGRPDQGLAYIGWPTTGLYPDTRQARTLDVLSDVFELRLIQKIREEQATTYSPQAAHGASPVFADYGIFSAQIEARPEALAGFLRDAEAIVADLRDRPIPADELQRALRPRVETLQRQRNGNPWWLLALGRVQRDPRVAPTIAAMIGEYEGITAADLQRAARTFLQPGRAWKLVVVPGRAAPAP